MVDTIVAGGGTPVAWCSFRFILKWIVKRLTEGNPFSAVLRRPCFRGASKAMIAAMLAFSVLTCWSAWSFRRSSEC